MENSQTRETAEKTLKPWYKKWWGVILIIALFPVTVPYLIWTKTSWKKWVKIVVMVIWIVFLINKFGDSSQKKEEAKEFNKQAEAFISENKINEAIAAIKKSEELDTKKTENTAFALDEKIAQLQSSDFLAKTLVEMSDDDFKLLKKGELKTIYIDHTELNKLFLAELQKNSGKRAELLAINEEVKQREAALARETKIKEQFSVWDGSHVNLTKLIKKTMNDPDSYEHVETKYWIMKDHLIVNTTFRGKNGFGGMVQNTVKAKVSLDGENIQIIEQY